MSLLRPTTTTQRLNWWEFQDKITPLNSFNCFFHEIKLCFLRCFWGKMIWVERASLVLGMGWSSRQIQRTTFPVFFTFALKYFLNVRNIFKIFPGSPGIWGVTVDLLALGRLRARPDADHLAALHDDLVDLLVQHVRPPVYSGQSGESLVISLSWGGKHFV